MMVNEKILYAGDYFNLRAYVIHNSFVLGD